MLSVTTQTDHTAFTLTAFERVDAAEYAQSWLVSGD
jgi:hypothetical protein